MTTTLSSSDITADTPRLTVRSRFVDDVDPGPGSPSNPACPRPSSRPWRARPPRRSPAGSATPRVSSDSVGPCASAPAVATGSPSSQRHGKAITAAAVIEDEVDHLGSGLMCFATVTYSQDSEVDSLLHIPEFVLGRRGGRVWMTTIAAEGATPVPRCSGRRRAPGHLGERVPRRPRRGDVGGPCGHRLGDAHPRRLPHRGGSRLR